MKKLVLIALDLDKQNEHKSGYIKLCNRRDIINEVRK